MTDYRIIRAAEDYELIIVVSPADATLDSETAQYYRYAVWKIGDQEPDQFHRISQINARGYFSGHADGLGFDIVPDQVFETLDAVVAYCNSEKSKTPRLPARFHQLLGEAHSSSEAVDRFDLTDDPAKVQKFRELCHQSFAAASELVRYCQMYGRDLLAELLPADLPTDMAERAKLRPKNYAQLSPREQWTIDGQLGILDWDPVRTSRPEVMRDSGDH